MNYTLFVFFLISLCLQVTAKTPNIDITADKISLNVATQESTLQGNVIVTFNGKTFKAEKIIVNQAEHKILRITACGNVFFVDPTTSISALSCCYEGGVVTFTGGVIIENNAVGTITADHARYNTQTQELDVHAKEKEKVFISLNKSKLPISRVKKKNAT
jgi:lipopolysaccharide transport protein LptA